MMDISASGLVLVKHYEHPRVTEGKCYLYRDGTGRHKGGVLTIGFGHVVSESDAHQYKAGISIEQATAILHDDLAKFVRATNSLVKVPLNQNQFDACISLIMNNGELPLHKRVGQYLNARQFDEAAQQFQLWCNAEVKGKFGPVAGLFYRRLTETLLFLTGEIIFAHTWLAAQPILTKIRSYMAVHGKACMVPRYKPGQFVG